MTWEEGPDPRILGKQPHCHRGWGVCEVRVVCTEEVGVWGLDAEEVERSLGNLTSATLRRACGELRMVVTRLVPP